MLPSLPGDLHYIWDKYSTKRVVVGKKKKGKVAASGQRVCRVHKICDCVKRTTVGLQRNIYNR